ncbi:MAG: hypothetical protein EOO88_53365 [Pedobacter sp.]|nr:MAG: hypothetical protein EOO88_53365 [Pedobacter sp.]
MVYNILNGDSLAYSFPAAKMEGDIIVFREALIDGDLPADYKEIVTAPDHSTFNLWFEYDLFCQVNMWFILSMINSLPVAKKVFAVYTSHLDKRSNHFWNGYGPANTQELQICYERRMLLREEDIEFGATLWKAYREGKLEDLTRLSKSGSPAFPYLEEAVKAHVDRFPLDGVKGTPERVIEDIIVNISTDFPAVCKEFWKRESIYGFGDDQLRTLYDKVMLQHLS